MSTAAPSSAPGSAPVVAPPAAPAVPTGPGTPGILRSGFNAAISGVTGLFKRPVDSHGHETGASSPAGKVAKVAAIGAGAAAGLTLIAGGVATYAVGKKVIEDGPSAARATARAPVIIGAHTVGTPFELMDRGYSHAANKVVGAPKYQALKGWTAPWKAVKNTVKALTIEPTRFVAGLAYGAVGAAYGPFKGFAEGVNRALGGDPNWRMPGFKWMEDSDGHEGSDETHHIEIDTEEDDEEGEHTSANGPEEEKHAKDHAKADAHAPAAAAHHRKAA